MSILGRFSSGAGLRLDLLAALDESSGIISYATVRSFYAVNPSKKAPLCISPFVSGRDCDQSVIFDQIKAVLSPRAVFG